MDCKEQTVIRIGLLILVIITISELTGFHAYADEEFTETIKDSIGGIYEDITDPIELPKDNPLNTTDEELEAVKKDGLNLLESLMNLFSSTHSLAKSGIEATSPIELDEFMLALIGIAVVGLIVLPILKRLGFDLLKLIVVGIIIVIIFMMLPLILE